MTLNRTSHSRPSPSHVIHAVLGRMGEESQPLGADPRVSSSSLACSSASIGASLLSGPTLMAALLLVPAILAAATHAIQLQFANTFQRYSTCAEPTVGWGGGDVDVGADWVFLYSNPEGTLQSSMQARVVGGTLELRCKAESATMCTGMPPYSTVSFITSTPLPVAGVVCIYTVFYYDTASESLHSEIEVSSAGNITAALALAEQAHAALTHDHPVQRALNGADPASAAARASQCYSEFIRAAPASSSMPLWQILAIVGGATVGGIILAIVAVRLYRHRHRSRLAGPSLNAEATERAQLLPNGGPPTGGRSLA
eukprot:m.178238 g.178238  ORF g.178238 m.178238 type:complete len:313 (-) comp9981_c1_seq11:102-1040(-)